MKERLELDIPLKTILKVIGVLLFLWFLYIIRDVAALFFIVFVIVAAISPVVDRWQKHMPRPLAVSLIYIILLAILVGAGSLIIPPIVSQIQSLAQDLPTFFGHFAPSFRSLGDVISLSQEGLSALSNSLGSITSSLYTTAVGFVGGLVAIVTLLFLTFYLLLEKEATKKFLLHLLPHGPQEEIIETANKISIKMGSWLRSQIALMVIVGLLDLIGLLILGVPFALTLAVWAGLTEIIPYIGPWIGLLPAALIGFSISPIVGILVIVIYLGVQQLEANFLVPKIMGKAVGLSPVIIIFALLVGAKLAGIIGIILAVPVAGVISVIYEEYPRLKENFRRH